jgi:hypothetical protein
MKTKRKTKAQRDQEALDQIFLDELEAIEREDAEKAKEADRVAAERTEKLRMEMADRMIARLTGRDVGDIKENLRDTFIKSLAVRRQWNGYSSDEVKEVGFQAAATVMDHALLMGVVTGDLDIDVQNGEVNFGVTEQGRQTLFTPQIDALIGKPASPAIDNFVNNVLALASLGA